MTRTPGLTVSENHSPADSGPLLEWKVLHLKQMWGRLGKISQHRSPLGENVLFRVEVSTLEYIWVQNPTKDWVNVTRKRKMLGYVRSRVTKSFWITVITTYTKREMSNRHIFLTEIRAKYEVILRFLLLKTHVTLIIIRGRSQNAFVKSLSRENAQTLFHADQAYCRNCGI